MALQQHHLLSDVTVRGFVAGATNILFRQQKHLSDAIVEVGFCMSVCPWHRWSLFSFLKWNYESIVMTPTVPPVPGILRALGISSSNSPTCARGDIAVPRRAAHAKELRDQTASIVSDPTTVLQLKCFYCLNYLNTSNLFTMLLLSRGSS